MSSTIPLPDGGSAVLRDPSTVTERQRRPVTRAQMRLAGSPVGELLDSQPADDAPEAEHKAFNKAMIELMGTPAYDLLDELNDALAAALVEKVTLPDGRTFDNPSADDLLDIPGADLDVIKAETAKYVTALMPSFAPTPDAESPTPPSAS